MGRHQCHTAEQRSAEVLSWADPVVEALAEALYHVEAAHPEMTANEMVMLIGEVAMQTLSPYLDPDFLREVWGVPDEEIPAVQARQDALVAELEQLPLW
jgi:hypothetical protein